MAGKPFTVIGGFLGAGKTTLINYLLSSSHGVRYAVLVNDFGDVNVDADLIISHNGQTLELSNGCICCSLSDGFVNTMLRLMQGREAFDHIVVEASGVSLPDRIMDFARIDRDLAEDGIIVLVDCAQIQARLADKKIRETIEAQLQSANILVLNKCDLVGDDRLAEVRTRLGKINPSAPMVVAEHARVAADLILGTGMEMTGSPSHAHTTFHALTLVADHDLSHAEFSAFCNRLPPTVVLRGKGHVRIDGQTYVWQKVGDCEQLLPSEEPRPSTIVLIATEAMDLVDEPAGPLLPFRVRTN